MKMNGDEIKMAIKMTKRRFQVSFAEDLYEKVDKYCDEAGISKSAYLSLLAAKDLEDTEKFLVDFRNELQEVIKKLNIEGE